MGTKETHKKSLELVEQFIKETPPEELEALKEKYRKMKIKGPTFAEYLAKFHKSFK